MEHTRLCREYRELYKEKLLSGSKKVSVTVMAELNRRLDELEHKLDTFNIGINRERAEAAADARKKVSIDWLIGSWHQLYDMEIFVWQIVVGELHLAR